MKPKDLNEVQMSYWKTLWILYIMHITWVSQQPYLTSWVWISRLVTRNWLCKCFGLIQVTQFFKTNMTWWRSHFSSFQICQHILDSIISRWNNWADIHLSSTFIFLDVPHQFVHFNDMKNIAIYPSYWCRSIEPCHTWGECNKDRIQTG